MHIQLISVNKWTAFKKPRKYRKYVQEYQQSTGNDWLFKKTIVLSMLRKKHGIENVD